MRYLIAIAFIVPPAFLVAQGTDDEGSIAALIKGLGSSNYRARQSATAALKARPDAMPALRQAMLTADLETQRRAAPILDYHAVRELSAAAKEGRVERVIELVAAWPYGKNEDEVWLAVHDLAFTLADLHKKKGGTHMRGFRLLYGRALEPLITTRLTESTRVKQFDGRYFVRAGEADLDSRRGKQENAIDGGAFMVVARSARLSMRGEPHAIFAGGSIELDRHIEDSVIVSGGDVTLKGHVWCSLVIARGKVTSTADLAFNRIIAGKSVEYNKKEADKCIITENEPNPLGFIRWSDAPKEKAAPKSK